MRFPPGEFFARSVAIVEAVRRPGAIPGILAILVLAGCGGSPSTSPKATALPASLTYDLAAAHVASCAGAGRAIPLPTDFPRQFPFPQGTVIDRVGRGAPLLKGQVGIYGFVPSPTFNTTVLFFKNEIVPAGFQRIDFEVDEPHDSEGTYRGHGKVGRWALQAIVGCPHVMRFSASAEKLTH